jgi:hypothetical protein
MYTFLVVSLFLSLNFFSLKAQMMVNLLSDSIVLVTEDLQTFFEEKTYLINIHSDTIFADFEVRDINTIPEEWSTVAFCFTSFPPFPGNPEICQDLKVSGTVPGQFKVPPGDSIELKLQISADGVPGKVVLPVDLIIEDLDFIEGENLELIMLAEFKSNAVSIRNIEKNSFNIYPNPAQNSINIKGLKNVSADAMVEIYSIIGVKVTELKYNYQAVDVSNLQRGVYLLKITDNNKNYSQTFIKQ